MLSKRMPRSAFQESKKKKCFPRKRLDRKTRLNIQRPWSSSYSSINDYWVAVGSFEAEKESCSLQASYLSSQHRSGTWQNNYGRSEGDWLNLEPLLHQSGVGSEAERSGIRVHTRRPAQQESLASEAQPGAQEGPGDSPRRPGCCRVPRYPRVHWWYLETESSVAWRSVWEKHGSFLG